MTAKESQEIDKKLDIEKAVKYNQIGVRLSRDGKEFYLAFGVKEGNFDIGVRVDIKQLSSFTGMLKNLIGYELASFLKKKEERESGLSS